MKVFYGHADEVGKVGPTAKFLQHFLVSQAKLGKTREDFPWDVVVVAPCGCRLILDGSACLGEPPESWFPGGHRNFTSFHAVVGDKCADLLIPVLLAGGWREAMPDSGKVFV